MASVRFPRIQSGLVAAPAMVMALGIFLLFACRFLLVAALGEDGAEGWLRVLSWGLMAWAAVLVLLFADQMLRDRKVLWDKSMEHFAIGTWVAGTSVLSGVVKLISPRATILISAVAWALWLLYMVWFSGLVRRTDLRGRINGTAFLTTVATQSLVVGTLRAWPGIDTSVLPALIAMNILGFGFYLVHFYMIWIAVGARRQIESWVPQNNITHGALSITLLAIEQIARSSGAYRSVLGPWIEALWVVTALLLVMLAAVELALLLSGRKDLLQFKMANYSRNFTYGMFFACTFQGAHLLPGSLIAAAASEARLVVLAIVVALVNVWELSHQITGALRQSCRVHAAGRAQGIQYG